MMKNTTFNGTTHPMTGHGTHPMAMSGHGTHPMYGHGTHSMGNDHSNGGHILGHHMVSHVFIIRHILNKNSRPCRQGNIH